MSEVEDKMNDVKKANENNNTLEKVMSIFKSLLSFGIILVIGALTLYSVRASQTGLIPTNIDCEPYTNLYGKLNSINVNINVVKSGENIYASRLNFPIDENILQMDKGFFGFLKKLIYGEKASAITLYIGKIMEKVMSVNFSFMNMIYNILNSYFPESLIIFMGPTILFFVQIVTVFMNMLLVVYHWFYNIYLLFSTKKEENGKTKWEEHSIFDVANLGWTVLYYFISFFLFCFCGLLVIPSVAIFVSLYCLFFPLFLQSNIVRGETDKGSPNKMKKFGLKQAIIDTFTFKKSIIMYISTLVVILAIAQDFSSYVLVGSILGFLVLFFFTDIYKQYLPKTNDFSTSGFASFEPIKIETVTAKKEEDLSTFQNILKTVM